MEKLFRNPMYEQHLKILFPRRKNARRVTNKVTKSSVILSAEEIARRICIEA
jgi:hypothetical protein